MKPTMTHGATHNFQAPENWDTEWLGPCGDLHVRMDVFEGNEKGLIECASTWLPSPEELAHLNAGGVIEVRLCVLNQPVMSMHVVDPVEAVLVPYLPGGQPVTINEDAHGDDAHGE